MKSSFLSKRRKVDNHVRNARFKFVKILDLFWHSDIEGHWAKKC